MQKDDVIYRRAAIDEIEYELEMINSALDSLTLDFNTRERLYQRRGEAKEILNSIQQLPPAQLEELTDDDFETIRMHLNAYKEKLCNQRRWKEAEEYQRIIDRFVTFASAQSELGKGKWIRNDNGTYSCSVCQSWIPEEQYHYARYCLYCGAEMRENDNEK